MATAVGGVRLPDHFPCGRYTLTDLLPPFRTARASVDAAGGSVGVGHGCVVHVFCTTTTGRYFYTRLPRVWALARRSQQMADGGLPCGAQVRGLTPSAAAAGLGFVAAGPPGMVGAVAAGAVAAGAGASVKGSNTVFAWALLALTILLEVRRPVRPSPGGGDRALCTRTLDMRQSRRVAAPMRGSVTALPSHHLDWRTYGYARAQGCT